MPKCQVLKKCFKIENESVAQCFNMKSEPAHLCADSNKSAGHSVHEVVLLGKERNNPAVDRLAG